jgi:hypothetical protein
MCKSGVAIVLSYFAVLSSCTRAIDTSKITIQLPPASSTSLSQKTVTSQAGPLTSARWGGMPPSTLSQIKCYAVAVSAPDLPNTVTCRNLNDDTKSFATIAGVFKSSEEISIEVPSGSKRKITLIGFSGVESLCTDIGDSTTGVLHGALFSPPVYLGSTEAELAPGTQNITLDISNFGASELFEECDEKPFASTTHISTVVAGGLPGGSTSATVFTNIPVVGYNADSFTVAVSNSAATCADIVLASTEYRTNSASPTITVNTSTLSDGQVNFCILGKDSVKNLKQTYPNIYTWIKDTAAPVSATVSVSATTNVTNPTFTVSNVETNAVVRLYRSTSSTPGCASGNFFQSQTATSTSIAISSTSAFSPDGTYYISADSVDRAGNVSLCSTVVSTTIDTTRPNSISVIGGGGLAGAHWSGVYDNMSPLFSWSAVTDTGTGLDHYEVAIGLNTTTDILNWTDIGLATSYTYLPSLLFSFGSNYTISVRAVDKAGNLSSTAASKTWKVYDSDTANWKQQAYFKSDYVTAQYMFGNAIAIDGNRMVIGSKNEEADSSGVGLTPATDNNAYQSGAAFVYKRNPNGNWILEAYLKPDNTNAGQHFGHAVAISGDTIVIGSPEETCAQTGVGTAGCGTFTGSLYGAVYTYKFDGTSWTYENYIKPSVAAPGAKFGSSVSIFRDTLVVGAPEYSAVATKAGAAYVFERSAGGWAQQTMLTHTSTAQNRFGSSVAIHNGVIAVTSVPDTLYVSNTGFTEIFEGSGATWPNTGTVTALLPETNDGYGCSVSVYGNYIAVGASSERGNSQGTATTSFVNGTARGAAFVYKKNTGSWSLDTYVKPNNTTGAQQFGSSVSLFENTLVVGAPGYSSSNGRVYIYKMKASRDYIETVQEPGNPNISNSFGYSVAISNSAIAVGGPYESAVLAGVQNTTIYNSASSGAANSGAAWLLESAP